MSNCIFDSLLDRLSDICGDYDDPYFALFTNPDKYTSRVLERGIVLHNSLFVDGSIADGITDFLVSTNRLFMEPNQCHKDAINALREYPKCSLMTGYVCCDGSWYVHSWLYSADHLLVFEPCISSIAECYYGFILTDGEVEEFSRECGVDSIKVTV